MVGVYARIGINSLNLDLLQFIMLKYLITSITLLALFSCGDFSSTEEKSSNEVIEIKESKEDLVKEESSPSSGLDNNLTYWDSIVINNESQRKKFKECLPFPILQASEIGKTQIHQIYLQKDRFFAVCDQKGASRTETSNIPAYTVNSFNNNQLVATYTYEIPFNRDNYTLKKVFYKDGYNIILGEMGRLIIDGSIKHSKYLVVDNVYNDYIHSDVRVETVEFPFSGGWDLDSIDNISFDYEFVVNRNNGFVDGVLFTEKKGNKKLYSYLALNDFIEVLSDKSNLWKQLELPEELDIKEISKEVDGFLVVSTNELIKYDNSFAKIKSVGINYDNNLHYISGDEVLTLKGAKEINSNEFEVKQYDKTTLELTSSKSLNCGKYNNQPSKMVKTIRATKNYIYLIADSHETGIVWYPKSNKSYYLGKGRKKEINIHSSIYTFDYNYDQIFYLYDFDYFRFVDSDNYLSKF